MTLYGLLGYPLGHSFSASYFAKKFASEQIDARYENFEFAGMDEAVPFLCSQRVLKGFNVTIPHKQAIIPHLSALSDDAKAIGAVNVVKVVDDSEGHRRFIGYNSDFIGFRDSLRPLLRPDVAYRALVLGTGGASKAVVYALSQLGIPTTYVSRGGGEGRLRYEELSPEIMAEHLLVVNCSPVGMYPHVDEAPAIPYAVLTHRHILYDLVYNPLTTRFMALGAAHGAVVKNGLDMLHLQAEAAWRIWQED